MTSVTLRYREDAATGLPRLEDPGGTLSPAEVAVIEAEVGRQFERLAGGPDGQLFALNGSAPPGVPSHFRVTVTERDRRCPTLLLEAVEPPAPEGEATDGPAAVSAGPGRWQAEFLAEAAELLARAQGDGGRSPLDFVLADLRALLRKDPRRFTLLLFAGYLHVGDALSLRNGEAGDNRYARAAEALAQFAGDALPEGVLDPLLATPDAPSQPTAPVSQEPESWWKRFFSFC